MLRCLLILYENSLQFCFKWNLAFYSAEMTAAEMVQPFNRLTIYITLGTQNLLFQNTTFVVGLLPVNSSDLLELCFFVFQLLFQFLLTQTQMCQLLLQLSLLAWFLLQLLPELLLDLRCLLPRPSDLTVAFLQGLKNGWKINSSLNYLKVKAKKTTWTYWAM